MKTMEEIFVKVANHLMAQRAKSTNVFGRCAYRGIDGRKCAIGCLVTDEVYNRFWGQMEGHGAVNLKVVEPLILSGIDKTVFWQNDRLFLRLQNIHDNLDPDEWRSALIDVAESRGFKWEPSNESAS